MYKTQKRPGTGFTKRFDRVIPRKIKVQENKENKIHDVKPVQDKLSNWIVKICFGKDEKEQKKLNSILSKSALILFIICILLLALLLHFKFYKGNQIESKPIYLQRLPHVILGYHDQSFKTNKKPSNGLATFMDFSPLFNSTSNLPYGPKRAKFGYFDKNALWFIETESCDFQKYSVDSECLDIEFEHMYGERYLRVGNSIWIIGK